jgi:hypothetical protein
VVKVVLLVVALLVEDVAEGCAVVEVDVAVAEAVELTEGEEVENVNVEFPAGTAASLAAIA